MGTVHVVHLLTGHEAGSREVRPSATLGELAATLAQKGTLAVQVCFVDPATKQPLTHAHAVRDAADEDRTVYYFVEPLQRAHIKPPFVVHPNAKQTGRAADIACNWRRFGLKHVPINARTKKKPDISVVLLPTNLRVDARVAARTTAIEAWSHGGNVVKRWNHHRGDSAGVWDHASTGTWSFRISPELLAGKPPKWTYLPSNPFFFGNAFHLRIVWTDGTRTLAPADYFHLDLDW